MAELKHYFANDGQDGIDKARELKPDLIFMDIQLPGINGIEATKEIRQPSEFMEIPIIGLSADAFVEQQQNALDSGMTDYLTKPIKFDNFISALNKYIPSTTTLLQNN